MPEVQKHGFSWEKNLICSVYGATDAELKEIKYTNKMDLPAALNKIDHVDLSVKTSCSPNAVCMADCLRVFDAVSSGNPIHMTVIYYAHNDETSRKRLQKVTEVDLTNSAKLLFGSLQRTQIERLVNTIREVPQKRSPTPEEYKKMYALRDELQPLSGAIHLDIKCNSQQSRLQCSFNHFQDFLKQNPDRIIATSTSGAFRGGTIVEEVEGARRVFKKKRTTPPVSDSTPHSPPI